MGKGRVLFTKYTKLILSILMIFSCISFTGILAEEPSSTPDSESTVMIEDDSDTTNDSLENSEDESSAEEEENTEDEVTLNLETENEEETYALTSINGNDNVATVEVGKGVVLVGEKNTRTDCNYSHEWTIKSGSDVVSVFGTGHTAYVKGLKEGTATIRHEYCYRDYQHDGYNFYEEHYTAIEWFEVTVTATSQVSSKKVLVYIAKDNYSNETLSSLGVKTDKLDKNGFIPVGVIELPGTYFENRDGGAYSDTAALIQTDEDWNTVMSALANMNTLTLKGDYASNQGNHVSDYLSNAKKALNERKNSGNTSLFYWSSYKGAEAFDDSDKSEFHLVLYFNTAQIQYVLGNDTENLDYKTGTVLATQTYVSGSNSVKPTTLTIPDDYKIAGYYSDEALTTPWNEGSAVSANSTVYVKLVKKTNVLIKYVVVGDGKLSKDEETFVSDATSYTLAGSTATAKSKSKFVGWYDNAACSGNPISTEATLSKTLTVPETDWPETITYYAKFESTYSRIKINCYWTGDTKNLIASFYTDGEIGKTVTIKAEDYDRVMNYSVKESPDQEITVKKDSTENVVNLYYYRYVTLQANGTSDTVFKYDGKEHEVTGYMTYLTGDKSKTDIGLKFGDLSASGKGTDVSTKEAYKVIFDKDITGTVDSSDKYKVSKMYPGEFWILNSLEIVATSASREYNGKALTVNPAAYPQRGTDITYSIDGGKTWTTEKPSLTNVGKLEVIAKATNDNYIEATCTYTIEVTKKELVITANDTEKVYGTSDPTFTATVSGFVTGDKQDIEYSFTREKGENIGTYTITPTTSATLENYSITCKTGKLEITKASTLTLTPELTGSKATKAYDGKALEGGAIASVLEGTKVTYSVDGKKTWSEKVPSITNVGKLEVTAKATNPNYEDVMVSYTLTVTEASSTPTPSPTVTPTSKTTVTTKKSSGWDDGGPFTTDTCGNVFDRWGNKIYEAKGCNVGGYNLVQTGTEN